MTSRTCCDLRTCGGDDLGKGKKDCLMTYRRRITETREDGCKGGAGNDFGMGKVQLMTIGRQGGWRWLTDDGAWQ